MILLARICSDVIVQIDMEAGVQNICFAVAEI